ncbi:hypothetical protein CKO31_16100 [Thiohalocapsa halophila]|uniref:Plasmid pRiA4b Orf3-like domain-containing protein n=1 Tax=Thiohalocapsa halophila TaxID=69359 RepID=A0ABS1CKK9_9GAMM|nr:hypothetical protein [Thiohalocapsa halophila]
MPAKRPNRIYQLKITLRGAKPPIWRRVLVPSDLALDVLHEVIQIAMGWTDSHLHHFLANGRVYGIPDDKFGFEFDLKDEAEVKLMDLLRKEKDSMRYDYDFGDGWEHQILVEKVLPFDETQTLPLCIKGKRACPPEDCGGIWGYAQLLRTLADPSDPEHQDMLEWVGGQIDPEAFDLDDTNEALSALRPTGWPASRGPDHNADHEGTGRA